MKNFTDTALHVYFAGNLRIHGCDVCCSRWYFTFNGAECSSPGSIDGAFYMQTGKNHNLHRHRHIEGHCNNIHKGKVRVGFWVGSCTGFKTRVGLRCPGFSLKRCQKLSNKHVTRDQLDSLELKNNKDKETARVFINGFKTCMSWEIKSRNIIKHSRIVFIQ